MNIDEKQLAKDLKPIFEFVENRAQNVKILHDLMKKYPFLNTRQKCGYCLYSTDKLS